ncbi:MAG: TIGR02453 family protein, partial [Phycisphaerae bacterium]|nr:TIGR02453 family protein [Phycisphaerae bacterium]
MEFTGFKPTLARFLAELARNNNRPWFARNRDRYEAEVREPVLAFIRAIGPRIEAISQHIFVSDSKVGGSMMRPYRDTRFSGDKEPYKTNVGIHFRHEMGESAHAPGFWMHIAPREFWMAVGMWKPDGETLARVRTYMAEHPAEYLAARDSRAFRSRWEIVGDALKRPPRGFDPNHPLIED